MEDKKIIEGNKLIAEFIDLGHHVLYPNKLSAPTEFQWMAIEVNAGKNYDEKNGIKKDIEEYLKFHLLWDWLMPVIEKIESLQVRVSIITNYVCIECQKRFCKLEVPTIIKFPTNTTSESKLNATWKCVVKFLELYNKQNLQNLNNVLNENIKTKTETTKQ